MQVQNYIIPNTSPDIIQLFFKSVEQYIVSKLIMYQNWWYCPLKESFDNF